MILCFWFIYVSHSINKARTKDRYSKKYINGVNGLFSRLKSKKKSKKTKAQPVVKKNTMMNVIKKQIPAKKDSNKYIHSGRRYKKVIMPSIEITKDQAQALYDAQMQFTNFRLQQLYSMFLPQIMNSFYGSLPEELQNMPFDLPYDMPIINQPKEAPTGVIKGYIQGEAPSYMIPETTNT